MPKRKTIKLSSRLLRIGHANLAVVAAFILVFAGFGSFFVYRSEAATWYCTDHEYYIGEPGIYHGYCVYQIQYAMQVQYHYWGKSKNFPNIGPVYGVYDGYTSNVVWHFQNLAHIGTDGIVGAQTWGSLCYDLTIEKYSESPSNYWWGRDGDTYDNLGCNNPHGYHSYPVN